MTTTSDETILKADSLGRVRIPVAKREEMLDAFEEGELSGAAFARKHGVPVQTFASWIQKRRRERGDYEKEEVRRKLRMIKHAEPSSEESLQRRASYPQTTEKINLIEVSAAPISQPPEGLEVSLPNGVRVKVSAESQLPLLRSLVRELSC